MPPRRRRSTLPQSRPAGASSRLGHRTRLGHSGGPAHLEAAGAERVLIDGRNVQRALERGSAPGSLPTAALVARLRAAFSPPTEVELILDGHPGGSPTGRVAPGFSVTFSRGATADWVIGERVAAALVALGPVGAWSVLVVSDDRDVQAVARRHGARVEGTAWLAARVAVGPGPRGGAIGHGRAPRPHARPPRAPELG